MLEIKKTNLVVEASPLASYPVHLGDKTYYLNGM